jgi:hypothetical protein
VIFITVFYKHACIAIHVDIIRGDNADDHDYDDFDDVHNNDDDCNDDNNYYDDGVDDDCLKIK